MTHDEEMRKLVWAAVFAKNINRTTVEEAVRIADVCLEEYDGWVRTKKKVVKPKPNRFDGYASPTKYAVLDPKSIKNEGE